MIIEASVGHRYTGLCIHNQIAHHSPAVQAQHPLP